MVFRCERHKQGVECAVCLGELSEGEEVRLLLGCKHAFHRRCIDMWFFSHSTCPLCRSPVVLDTPEPANSGAEASPLSSSSSVGGLGSQGEPEKPDSVAESPHNQDYSGEQSSTSSGSSSGTPPGALVIEIPRSTMDDFQTPSSPLPASSLPEEAISTTTTTATLRSLRRLLIRGSRVAAASCSPRGHDVEQEGHGPISKAPTSSCH
ncbi:RING-H2 finger protein [Musa troglodytarum]|uniref:RING-type E3 ubiquitin transferase n=1 Tax=Musa troglodytarum TaxID=320322 RepID=A0A9E7GA41_9LILI|nr:RING-H2 finger protein [Musa troglodytarum]